MKKNELIKQISINALLIALTAIATAIISFPIGTQGGYLNFGDTIIFITSLFFGPLSGFIVGAVGSCIADLFLAPAYAVFTFFIKGLEGFLVGIIFKKMHLKERIKALIAMSLGTIVMVIGYYLTGLVFYSFNFYDALLEVPLNLLQGVVSLTLAFLLYNVFDRIITNSVGREE